MADQLPLPDDVAATLASFELGLDTRHPTAGGRAEVLGTGEVSVALRIDDLPGWVCKRMSGFADETAMRAYEELVADYLRVLRRDGVQVADTHLVPVIVPKRRPVVYLLQPEMPAESLGHHLLRDGRDSALSLALGRVLDTVDRVLRVNPSRRDGSQLAVDAQLSNWSFPVVAGRPGEPVLIDVGTPFVRGPEGYRIDVEIFLSALPVGARAWYRRKRAVEAYLDDYFDPRTVALDILGNFHKEGRADRVRLGLDVVNAWLSQHHRLFPDSRPITEEEVAAYYKHDAEQLELFLRVRRIDRGLRTRLLHRRYDFVLPAAITR